MRNPKMPVADEPRARMRELMRSAGLPGAARVVGLDSRTYEKALEGAPVTHAIRTKITAALPLLPATAESTPQ